MWERRYGFPSPRRNEAKIRVYSKDDVERLTLVARALKAGYRAGEVIRKTRPELDAILAQAAQLDVQPTAGQSPNVATVLEALRRDDADGIRLELRRAVATLGPKRFVVDVASPLLQSVGEAWAARQLDVRHEHVLSEQLSTQLRLLLSAYEGTTQRPVVLLTALPGEQHGLGLDMVALFTALIGATPRMLGVDTPVDQIAEAAAALGADVVGISVSGAADIEQVKVDLEWLLDHLPDSTEVWLGGERARSVQAPRPRVLHVISWTELERELLRQMR
jgi:methanogenic corrinoid protein MtbC1